jgi:preprotein translocase subunit SecG
LVVNRSASTRKQVGVTIGVAIALAVTVAVFLVPGTSGGAGDALVGQPFVKESSK